MKKLTLGVAIAMVSLFAMSSAASANITSPAVGGAVASSGWITISGNVLTTRCTISLSGRVASTLSISVTGGSGSCNTGTLTLTGFPWTKTLLLSGGVLTGEWDLRTIGARVDVPLFGSCIYSGTLAGRYTSDGIDTTLTVGDVALISLTLDGSSASFCSDRPRIGGELVLEGLVIS